MNKPEAYPHQVAEQAFAHVPKRALFWSPRIGKTRGTADSLVTAERRKTLVIAPLAACSIWKRQLELEGFEVATLYNTPTESALARLVALPESHKVAAVVNFHRLPQPAWKHMQLADVLRSWRPDSVVIDESHYISSPSSRWANATRKIAWDAPWVRCLSGTPAPNNWGSLWGGLSALDPGEWGWYFKPFAQKYLVTDPIFPRRVLAYREPELFKTNLDRYCNFVRREDVFGPDQWVPGVRIVELPPRARSLYDQLAREWLIEEEDPQLLVDGSHILTRMLRLQEIASGYVAPADGLGRRDVHTAKLDAVIADLSEIVMSREKAVIFHRFTWEAQQLTERVAELCPFRIMNGDSSPDDRDETVRLMREAPGAFVAIVQTQSGGIAIDFSEASHALVLSQSFSFVQEQQARDRIYKRNAVRHVMYYQAEDTVDGFIAHALTTKLDMHNDLFKIDRKVIAHGTA